MRSDIKVQPKSPAAEPEQALGKGEELANASIRSEPNSRGEIRQRLSEHSSRQEGATPTSNPAGTNQVPRAIPVYPAREVPAQGQAPGGEIPGSDPSMFADYYQDQKVAAAKRDPSGRSGSVHTVEGGESLAKIAREHGINLAHLIKVNPIFAVQNPNTIHAGMELWIPPKAR